MRYPEPKEQSVALLRQVLIHLGRHDVAANPLAFAVFYEHAGGTNRRLSMALEAALVGDGRLTDDIVRRLHRDFVADAGSDETERIRGDLQRVMSSVVDSAARTGQAAGLFGESLAGLSQALGDGNGDTLAPHVGAALAGTEAMRSAVTALQDRVASSQQEIDQLRADLSRTRELATMCPLTRVLNRRGFDEQLHAMLGTQLEKGQQHCLILLDIDHFKRVNDSHGHLVGDRVLGGLGELLRNMPAEPGMVCARFGGEEFAILLPSTTVARAVRVAEAVCARTRAVRFRSKATKDVALTVTLSAGVAAWHPGEPDTALLSSADKALYRSKENGRDRVTMA